MQMYAHYVLVHYRVMYEYEYKAAFNRVFYIVLVSPAWSPGRAADEQSLVDRPHPCAVMSLMSGLHVSRIASQSGECFLPHTDEPLEDRLKRTPSGDVPQPAQKDRAASSGEFRHLQSIGSGDAVDEAAQRTVYTSTLYYTFSQTLIESLESLNIWSLSICQKY